MTCVKNNPANKKHSDKPIPELLAPCGSAESIDAAVLGGADAIYLGGRLFNARINARNFTDDALRESIVRCHAGGIKVYITLNTQIYDREMEGALRYAAFLYEAGADALIIADLGLAALIRQHMPEFALHGSTQISGHNVAATQMLSKLGFSRMVCARELSAENVTLLVENSPLDIEMFIHGAICVSHSGQCLLSFVMGGRSGNRGECAQPCRMSYNGGHPLSLRDLCLAGHMPAIIDSGVTSLKIEGRMKSPEYVYEVTSLYRRLLDDRRPATSDEIKRLTSVFSRSGFTDGYYKNRIGPQMMGVRTDRDKAATSAIKTVFSSNGRLAEAISTEQRVASLPVKLSAGRQRSYHPDKIRNTARFMSPDKIIGGKFFDTVYLPLALYVKTADNVTGVVLPGVISDLETAHVDKLLKKAYENGARLALVGNIGHIEIARERGFDVFGDFGLNIFNRFTAAVYDNLGDVILSPELTLPQIRDIAVKNQKSKGVIVYGRIPVMLLEKPVGSALLRDRKGTCFPVIHDAGRDILLNSVPVYMADKGALLDGCGIDERHFIFTVESRQEVSSVIEAYKKGTPPSGKVRRVKQ